MENATAPTVTLVHISEIRVGDVVEHLGEIKTVGRRWLKSGGLFGPSLWGDSYRAGTVPVRLVRRSPDRFWTP